MNQLTSLLFSILIFTTVQVFADDWGKTGHRVTAAVADRYLTEASREKIRELLQGQSLELVSNYADDIKSDSRFDHLDPWHYVNFPLGEKYKDEKAAKGGDIVQAIEKCIEVLKDPGSTRDDKEFYLKLLVHFIGDLHQPLHIGRADDRGGNNIQLRWFSRGSNLHRVWDTQMVEQFGMSYSELSDNLPVVDPRQIKEIMMGDYNDWMYDTRKLTESVYGSVRVGEKLGYRYMYDHFDSLRWQLLKGGIRLASLLNEIFDPA
ncbi:S1/P1 Nuclease [Robertkochia marina]|uniref:S1/P1 Nuclease n=1 Tax=Robertkochia marina TaxID=1227945 RepID=A0A4S3LWV4_9FLAO|nr:S1/P1 nuclease [Robertkochia marina]THD65658.1 S1/P1 Nuclease [Robertkochia marina]TRZ46661.1 S1/P1 Nuclease [Robertkochia marina]